MGPAGAILDRALTAAGLSRGDVYVTNAVKHFKWEPRGKRRLHAKPTAREIKACRPWLEAEIEAVDPLGIPCLGATAAQVLLRGTFRLTKHLGERLPWSGARCILATFHPSAVLRAPTSQDRQRMMRQFTSDLRLRVTRRGATPREMATSNLPRRSPPAAKARSSPATRKGLGHF